MADFFPGAELIFDANSSEGLALVNEKMKKSGNAGAEMFFAVDHADLMETWSPQIKVKKALPRFTGVPRLPQMDDAMKRQMDFCDESHMILQIHLQFKAE